MGYGPIFREPVDLLPPSFSHDPSNFNLMHPDFRLLPIQVMPHPYHPGLRGNTQPALRWVWTSHAGAAFWRCCAGKTPPRWNLPTRPGLSMTMWSGPKHFFVFVLLELGQMFAESLNFILISWDYQDQPLFSTSSIIFSHSGQTELLGVFHKFCHLVLHREARCLEWSTMHLLFQRPLFCDLWCPWAVLVDIYRLRWPTCNLVPVHTGTARGSSPNKKTSQFIVLDFRPSWYLLFLHDLNRGWNFPD